MEAELPWQWIIAYNMSILSPMKLKFDMLRDIPQPNKCTEFQLLLTLAYFLVAMATVFIEYILRRFPFMLRSRETHFNLSKRT